MDINATLIGQLLTFLILIWFTMKYVWPPITKAMQDREKKIAAGLEAAERSKRELEQAEHKALTIIRDAKLESSHIIDQAHKRSTHIVEEAKENARIESGRILERAQEEIAREITQAKEALRKQLATLAIAGAEKIIQRNLDASAQAALLDEFAAEI
ncbi:MAG: F0F1 ATP synthase subunit B [Gammaproteobacteria bacterium]